MSPLQKFTLRLVIYGGLIAYLLADLFLFHGPLAKQIDAGNPFSAENLTIAKSNGVVARVYTHQITRGQLDRAVNERLWLTGAEAPKTPDAQKLLRYAALNDLIDHELLRTKSMAYTTEVKVSDKELKTRLQRFQARFASEDAMLKAMRSQGIPDMMAFRERLIAHIQQEKYVALKIGPMAQVAEDEARAWYDEHREALSNPEQIQVRHIFLASLSHTDAEAQEILNKALESLQSGTKDFATIAREISEDPTSQGDGGSLGWVSRHRLPDDLAKTLFDLPLNKTTIIQSKIGWHLAEVTGRKAAQPKSYESAKPEIIAAVEAIKRREAIQKFRKALRQFEAKRITIFHDMLEK